MSSLRRAPVRLLTPRSTASGNVNLLLVGSIVVAALFFGRAVLVPLAMSILLAFAFTPVVTLMRRYRVPHAAAVTAIVAAMLAALLALTAAITTQIGDLASELPRYEGVLRDKVRDLRGATNGNGAMERAARTLRDLKNELEKPDGSSAGAPAATGPASRTGPSPLPVEVHYPEPRVLDRLLPIVTTLLEPVAKIGMVVVFLFFVLLQRQDLRDRFIRLAGATDIPRTTAAMNDAGSRLSRYLLTLTLLNAAFGIFIAAALWAIGLPAPLLWGLIAALMRFVPFIGSPIAAGFPVILAAAIDPGWSTLWMTLTLFVVAELAMGQLVEPLVQGQSTGLSPVAIVAAAAFWTLLWGPIGLILAVPLTVCLVVLGQHVDSFGFLHVMLADEPALTPPERFFQRLLAGDANEVSDQAEKWAREGSLASFYEEVGIEGLRLAQVDADTGLLSPDQLDTIDATVATMVDNLWDVPDREMLAREQPTAEDASAPDSHARAPTKRSHTLPPDEAPSASRPGAVLCLPARTALDRAVCRMLAHELVRQGLQAEVVEHTAPTPRELRELAGSAGAALCICALGRTNRALSLRFLARRLRRNLPSTRIVAVLMGATEGEAQPVRDIAPDGQIDRMTTDFTSTVTALKDLLEADRDVAPASEPDGAPFQESRHTTAAKTLADPALS